MSTYCHRTLFSLVIVSISVPAFAADILWVGNQSDHMVLNGAASFHDGNNWYNYLPPGTADDAEFGSGFDPQGNDTLPHYIYFGAFQTSYAPPASSPFIPATDAVVRDVIVADGADWTFDFGTNVVDPIPGPTHGNLTASLLSVGSPKFDATPGSAILRLVGAGTAQFNNIILVGVLPNTQGELTIGADVLFKVGQGLNVGGTNASGSLTVQEGGEIQLDLEGDGAGIVVGEGNGALGSVVVRGTGSRIRGGEQSGMTIGGIFHTPQTGTGSLTIEQGGTVELGQWGVFLGESQASGSATIQGVGSQLTVDGVLVVANGGEGNLLIRDGATVTNTGATVGGATTAVGTAIVEGAETTWVSSGEFNVGYFGQGSLTIRDSAHLMGTFFSAIGRAETGVGEVLVTGEDSTWTTSIVVGDQGQGILDVEDGATVFSRGGAIGNQAGSVGTVTIDGTGSSLVVDSPAADDMNIGVRGEAVLNIQNGAAFSHDHGNTIIARAVGSEGSVTVNGAGSEWQSNTLIIASGEGVGPDDDPTHGIFTVSNGATATVSFGSSIGLSGHGELRVESGGTFHNSDAIIGQLPGAVGEATVSGLNSTWQIGTNLIVGQQGVADLSVNENGWVGIGGLLQIGAGGVVDVDDNGIVNVGTGPAPVPGTLRVGPDGTLAGSGEITGNVLVEGGTVSPGASPGALKITGSYHQLPGSVLSMEIGGIVPGSEYDQLLVTGDLSLLGSVQITFIDGFLPLVGDTFNLFSAGGTFNPPSSLSFLNAPPAFDYTSAFNNGVFSLTVISVPEPQSILLASLVIGVGLFRRRRKASCTEQFNR